MTFAALAAAPQPWSEAMMKAATRTPIARSLPAWSVLVLKYLHPVALVVVFMAVYNSLTEDAAASKRFVRSRAG